MVAEFIKITIQDDENNYHDSLKVHLIEGICHFTRVDVFSAVGQLTKRLGKSGMK